MSALSKGGATGVPGEVNVDVVDIVALDKAAMKALSTGLGKGGSTRVKRLKGLVGLIRPLRCAQRARDWQEVDRIVDTLIASMADFGDALDVCRREVNLAIADVEHRRLVARVNTSFALGAVTETDTPLASKAHDTFINVSSVSCEALVAALASLDTCSSLSRSALPASTVHLLDVAETVCRMRGAVVSGSWKEAAETVEVLLSNPVGVRVPRLRSGAL